MMKAHMGKFVLGAGTFGVALLYFYALALSIVAIVSGAVPEYVIVTAWAGVSIVLYYSYNRRRQAAPTETA
jgi:hypothetical protein